MDTGKKKIQAIHRSFNLLHQIISAMHVVGFPLSFVYEEHYSPASGTAAFSGFSKSSKSVGHSVVSNSL